MRTIELFAGAGGASLGLVAAGCEEVRAVEWNHDACETRRAAGLRCDEGDVRDPKHYEGVGDIDLLWSSFPCQAWSTAGKRLGADDPRNGWPWTVDAIDRVHPRWFIAENVPGLTHHRGGCNGRCEDNCARLYLEQTILRQLGERFAWVGWTILDAARFGVPQNRERLFIVAGPRAIRWPKETHAPPEELRAGGLFGETRRAWVTVREALNLGGAIIRESGVRADAPAPALRSGGAGHSAPPMWLRTGNQTLLGNRDRTEPYERDVDEPAPTIRVTMPHELVTRAASRPELLDRPAPAVTTCEVKGTRGETQHGGPDRASDAAWLGAGIRRLSPEECAILQAFPPDHPWRGTKTSIYAQIGNAVCPPMAAAVARAVIAADE